MVRSSLRPSGMFTSSPRAPGLHSSTVHCFYVYRLERRDGAHLIASVKPFQTLAPEYEMHFWPMIDLLHCGRANSEEVAFRVP